MTRRHLIALPTAAAVGLVAAAGAGVSGAADGEVSAAALKRTARIPAAKDNRFRFTRSRVRVRHGRVTLISRNPSGNVIPHGIAVALPGPNKEGNEARPGKRSVVRVRLRKGKYTFYCPVRNHRSFGMKGRLIVK
jgi:plastocyanin